MGSHIIISTIDLKDVYVWGLVTGDHWHGTFHSLWNRIKKVKPLQLSHTFFPACLSTMAPSLSLPGLAMVQHLTSCDSYNTVGSLCTWRRRQHNSGKNYFSSDTSQRQLTTDVEIQTCGKHKVFTQDTGKTSLNTKNIWMSVVQTVYREDCQQPEWNNYQLTNTR